jgi:hypothetical protein
MISLSIVFAFTSCKPSFPPSQSGLQESTSSNFLSDVKNKTGITLSATSKLLVSGKESTRSDTDRWLIRIDKDNQPDFPQSVVLDANTSRGIAAEIEKLSGVSITGPIVSTLSIWQVTNGQCHATMVTTSNCAYLMLERFY